MTKTCCDCGKAVIGAVDLVVPLVTMDGTARVDQIDLSLVGVAGHPLQHHVQMVDQHVDDCLAQLRLLDSVCAQRGAKPLVPVGIDWVAPVASEAAGERVVVAMDQDRQIGEARFGADLEDRLTIAALKSPRTEASMASSICARAGWPGWWLRSSRLNIETPAGSAPMMSLPAAESRKARTGRSFHGRSPSMYSEFIPSMFSAVSPAASMLQIR